LGLERLGRGRGGGGRVGDGNERTGDEASSRRERSETADGRSNPDHRKGSPRRGEDILQGRGGHNGARIHLALERVLRHPPKSRSCETLKPRTAACRYLVRLERI